MRPFAEPNYLEGLGLGPSQTFFADHYFYHVANWDLLAAPRRWRFSISTQSSGTLLSLKLKFPQDSDNKKASFTMTAGQVSHPASHGLTKSNQVLVEPPLTLVRLANCDFYGRLRCLSSRPAMWVNGSWGYNGFDTLMPDDHVEPGT